jgi:PAS domain S-box-containing protein
MPIFVVFVPSWLLSPLARLRQIASKIELGHLKDMPVRGRDEVAMLARSLKSYFLRKEDLEQKKSSKIFEMRNVLRGVINRVSEPVFIVDSSSKINYINDAGASLVGIPAHQVEGKLIADCMHAPAMKKILEKAFLGTLIDQTIQIAIETMDGRTCSMKTKIGMVRNRDGEVSRAVIVMS